MLVNVRHNTGPYWRYIASNLRFATRTRTIGELSRGLDINVMPSFYENMRSAPSGEAREALGEEGVRDVVARCRLLRNLPTTRAHRMVDAMWRTLVAIVERERPDAYLSFMVDSYVLDLMERILRRRGVPFVGVVDAVVAGHVMLMARGEHSAVREPTQAEVDAAIDEVMAPTFAPFVPIRPNYSYLRFLRIYAWFYCRANVFDGLRIAERDPLNWRYLLTSHHIAEYRLRLRDWKVTHRLAADWRARLQSYPFDRRVFVALQQNPEASIDYWVRNRELINYEDVLDRLVRVLTSNGFGVFVKDHPNMFAVRQLPLMERLAAIPGVTLVPYAVPSQELIRICKASYTWTGTVGLQAALQGHCSIVTSPYYFVEGRFLQVNDLADIDDLPTRIDAWAPPDDLRAVQEEVVRHMLRACVPGTESWHGFGADRPDKVARVRPLVESLNEHIPTLIARARVR